MRRLGVELLVVAAIAPLTLALPPNGFAATQHSVAHAAPSESPLYGWRQLSTGRVDSTGQIGVTRVGSGLSLVWVDTVGDKYQLQTATVTKTGAVAVAANDVLPTAFGAVDDFPSILHTSAGLTISFGALNSNDEGGYQYLSTSQDGKHWSVQGEVLSNDNTAYDSLGSDTAQDDSGHLLQVYTAETSQKLSYHLGTSPMPSSPSDDAMTTTTGDVYNAGVGYDAAANTASAVWLNSSKSKSVNGIVSQQIAPSLGPLIHAPDSDTKSSGSYQSTNTNQRIDVAQRAGGGLYAAYVVGYPNPGKIALWQVGTGRTLVRKVGADTERVNVADGQGGRIWVFWYTSGDTIEAARTNPSATQLGCASTVTTPNRTDSIDAFAGDGSLGPLQLAISAGANPQVYTKVVKACLSVSVSPHTISQKHGGVFTVTVKDAGVDVAGATVNFNGETYRTGKDGTVQIHAPKGLGTGDHGVEVKDSGYVTARAQISVH